MEGRATGNVGRVAGAAAKLCGRATTIESGAGCRVNRAARRHMGLDKLEELPRGLRHGMAALCRNRTGHAVEDGEPRLDGGAVVAVEGARDRRGEDEMAVPRQRFEGSAL